MSTRRPSSSAGRVVIIASCKFGGGICPHAQHGRALFGSGHRRVSEPNADRPRQNLLGPGVRSRAAMARMSKLACR